MANTQNNKVQNQTYVDLGLTSGTLWATCNVGAENPWEYGSYFAWGEIIEKREYSWKLYAHCTGNEDLRKLTKYNTRQDYKYGEYDNKLTLDLIDDAAYKNMGKNWRMPTRAEIRELLDECKWIQDQKNGVDGYTVVGPNNNSIFLPAASYKDNDNIQIEGVEGMYLTSSLVDYQPLYMNCLHFTTNETGIYECPRHMGYTVRAVVNRGLE